MKIVKRATSRVLRAAATPSSMRFRPVARVWTAAIGAPGLPDGIRGELAERVHVGLVGAGRPADAAAATARAARRMKSGKLQAELAMRQVGAEIAGGTPAGLGGVAAAQLALADAAYAKRDVRAATAAIFGVQKLLFDRRLHYDRLTSPLADDPTAYLAPWHASAAVRALSAPRGRSAPAAPPPVGRPTRLLIATYGNHGFINPIRAHFEARPDVEVRFVDPTGEPDHVSLMSQRPIMESLLAGGDSHAFRARVQEWLAPHVEWADVVFVDWCAALAVLFSMVDPGPTRMIVRLHSFEAFALWPHLVDFTRVDDLIFVSDLLRDLAVEAAPAMAAGPRLHVLANAAPLTGFRRPKAASARFNLAVVGIKALAKDPRWAVEVLRDLRTTDDRYRLHFYGRDLDAGVNPDSRAYWDAFLAEIAEWETQGVVVRHGQQSDMPAALAEIGVIISSSVRESFHLGLVEGAASGAVPVVRDWPFFAGRAANARTLFPADWVVGSPAEAAARIRAVTVDEDTWRAAGGAAADHVIGAWDWDVVRRDFDRVVIDTSEH